MSLEIMVLALAALYIVTRAGVEFSLRIGGRHREQDPPTKRSLPAVPERELAPRLPEMANANEANVELVGCQHESRSNRPPSR